MLLGNKAKELRDEHGVLQCQLAVFLLKIFAKSRLGLWI